MSDFWKYLRAFCCEIEHRPTHEARCRMKDGSIKIGAVCVCGRCGKRWVVW